MAAAGEAARIEQWAGIEELARMSIGTDKGAWYADPGFGSELWLLRQTGKADGQTAGILKRMVRESLQWLVDGGLASSVSCSARRGGRNRIDCEVLIIRPDGIGVGFEEAWNVV